MLQLGDSLPTGFCGAQAESAPLRESHKEKCQGTFTTGMGAVGKGRKDPCLIADTATSTTPIIIRPRILPSPTGSVRDTTQALERNRRWHNRHDARRIREYNLIKINLVSPHFSDCTYRSLASFRRPLA